MKTETQIAQENIERYKIGETSLFLEVCREHKSSCERFLGFLDWFDLDDIKEELPSVSDLISKKITDLKQAIKLYSENGI